MNQGQTEFGLNKKIPNNSTFALGLVSFSVKIFVIAKSLYIRLNICEKKNRQ
jgi:hypothetical protein